MTERRTFEGKALEAIADTEYHDDRCESEFVPEAGAWTPCACDERITAKATRESADSRRVRLTPYDWYRKQPIRVQAVRFTGETHKLAHEFLGPDCRGINIKSKPSRTELTFWCEKSQAVVTIQQGDWVIAETDGTGFYPCAADIFARTYRPLDPEPEQVFGFPVKVDPTMPPRTVEIRDKHGNMVFRHTLDPEPATFDIVVEERKEPVGTFTALATKHPMGCGTQFCPHTTESIADGIQALYADALKLGIDADQAVAFAKRYFPVGSVRPG